jgi:hypothetical protein
MRAYNYYRFSHTFLTVVFVQIFLAILLEGVFILMRIKTGSKEGRWAHLLSVMLISTAVGAILFEAFEVKFLDSSP